MSQPTTNPFKLQINLTKAYKDEHGDAYIEGVASGPKVDLTNERMDPKALESMVASIEKRIIELRDAHKDEWNDDIGEVVSLSLSPDYDLLYKAKLDLRLSKAQDLWYRMTEKGRQFGVSIGGSVVRAGKEWVAELGREIYTYFDVELFEISITRQAAYQHSYAAVVTNSLPGGSVAPITKARSDAQKLTDAVYDALIENYPEDVLGWVKDASWEKRDEVALDQIDMARRPGGRDQDKVKAIAQAIEEGKQMDPVVLVDDGTDLLKIADGYHRTLAYKHANQKTIAAYVATGVELGGPWEEEMHDAKLNKSEHQTEDHQEVVAKTDELETQADTEVVEIPNQDTNLTESAAAADQADANEEAPNAAESPAEGEDAAQEEPDEAAAPADAEESTPAETPEDEVEQSTDAAEPADDPATDAEPDADESGAAEEESAEGEEVAKSAIFGEFAQADVAAASVRSLTEELSWRVWGAVYNGEEDERTPAERKAFIAQALTEYSDIVQTVCDALIDNGTTAETEKSFVVTRAEAIAKSLGEQEAQVADLTKALSDKTTELETVHKSLEEKTQELATTATALEEATTKIETFEARKAMVFDKYGAAAAEHPLAPGQAASPTLSRWLNA